MKTSLEKTSVLGRKLTIEVPAEKVSAAFDRVYKELQKNATIKGFRKGKAPIAMLKSVYGDRINRDVIEEVVSHSYTSALKEHSLQPIGDPAINFKNALEDQKDFHFVAEFEIRPDIQIKKIEKLKVEKEKLNIPEEKVDSVVAQICESKADIVPIFEDRPAQLNDIVDIDFVGTIDGQPLDGGSMTDYKLHLGSNSFIPGFEDGIIGMPVGTQKELHLNFPPDYGHKDIAGKAVKFNVTLKKLMKKNIPPLTDEFVKSLGGFDSVEKLKSTIREDITNQEKQRIQEDLKTRLLKILVKENPIEVPRSLQSQQKNFLISDVEKRMRKQGMSPQDLEDYKRKWDKDFDDTAAFMIQTSFLIEALAEKYKLAATQVEFEDRIKKYASESGLEIDKLKEYYLQNNEQKHQLRYQITEEKVVDYVLSTAEIKELDKDKLSAS